MDNASLTEIVSILNYICDSTGLARAVLISNLYDRIKNLSDSFVDKENKWKEERIKLEAEIADLKEALSMKGPEQNGE